MSLSVDFKLSLPDFDLKVAFDAPTGITALSGHSGAGKTTLINVLAGLVTPDYGHIETDGRVLFSSALKVNLKPEERHIGYIFQDARLFPHLTVLQNLKCGRWFRRLPMNPSTIEEIVTLLGIDHVLSRRPSQLSGGEKQRVAIGRALLSEPEVILADEPLSSLDSDRKKEILPYFEMLRDQMSIPIVYVSHDADEVTRLATTHFELAHGKRHSESSDS